MRSRSSRWGWGGELAGQAGQGAAAAGVGGARRKPGLREARQGGANTGIGRGPARA
jgi:hypothetical protein